MVGGPQIGAVAVSTSARCTHSSNRAFRTIQMPKRSQSKETETRYFTRSKKIISPYVLKDVSIYNACFFFSRLNWGKDEKGRKETGKDFFCD